MKIYIPKHLVGRIPIINQLYKMVLGYSTEYDGERDEDYYYYYYYGQRLDDVTRFIEYVIPDDEDEERRNNNISYLTKLFYSVKGTCKVFDYILKYNLFQTTSEDVITYDSQTISITIEELPFGLDYDVFCEYLEKFLSALVWFENLNISIGSSKIEITGSVTTCLSSGSKEYQKLWN